MAEHTSTRPHKGHQRMRAETEAKAAKWPGGLLSLLADYRDSRTTLNDIMRVTGMQYRGLRRVLESHGVSVRDRESANAVAHALLPEWGNRISHTKRQQAFRHPAHVTRQATAKRDSLFRSDPSRHGVAHMKMNPREQQFAASLTDAGFSFIFNQAATPYFVDFYLPDLGVVLEVHRSQRPPCRERVTTVRQQLKPSAVVYVPTHFFVPTRYKLVTAFLREIRQGVDGLADSIGDALFLWDRRAPDAEWHGFRFKRRWH